MRAYRPEAPGGSPRQRAQTSLPQYLYPAERVRDAVKAFFGYEAEEPVLESTAPTEASTRERVTRAEERSPLERTRRSWRETDYHARLERAIAAPRLTRCATLAVVSPKGGVGKTTTAALLGSLLARVRSDRTVAVDTNPDYGSLGRTLAPDHGVHVDQLMEVLDDPELSVTALDAHLGRAFDGLMVLPAPVDPDRMAMLDEAAYTRVIRRLQSLVGILVLDCGTGLQEPAARAAQACADQILLVSDAHPSTASLVAEASQLLRTAEPTSTLVLNRMPSSERELRLDLGGLERLVPEARGLVQVQEEPKAASLVANGEFAWGDAPGPWQRSIRELAAIVTAEWAELGIAR